MADWDVVSQEPVAAPQADPWKVVAQEPAGDPNDMPLGRLLLGNLQLGGAAVANIPHALLHAGNDIINRVKGDYDAQDPEWIQNLHVPTGAAGQELAQKVSADLVGKNDAIGASDLITKGVGKVNETASDIAEASPFTAKVVAPLAADVATIAGARAPLQSAVQKGVSAVRGAGAALDTAKGVGTDWEAAGLRTGGGHPVARAVAGETGPEALKGHNAKVARTIAANEAGHAPDADMTYESLAKAREEPSAVYNRVARVLPEGQLDATAQAEAAKVGSPEGGRMSKGSPQAQQHIEALRQQILDPNQSFTGDQMVNELRGLRQEGFKNSASEDVSNQQLGKAQLQMAKVIEGHIERNLPKGGDVDAAQFKAAREALAKNHVVESVLRGGDVDLKALGRLHRNDPGTLTGGLKTLAEFAEGAGKDVSGLPNRYNEPSVLNDMASWRVERPTQSTIQAIPGFGKAARRFLTGSTDAAIQKAQSMFPARGADVFRPKAGLRPPPGKAGREPQQMSLGDLAQGEGPPAFELGEGANPNPKAPEALGDYATVMSEGVPPSGAPPLSAGPMGVPPGEGLPFKQSPEVFGAKAKHGGAPKPAPRVTDDYGNSVDPEAEARPRVKLGDRFAGQEPQPGDRPAERLAPGGEPSLGDLLTELEDYAKVKAEGVPEDTMTRASPGQRIQNNASGESSASVEAINRDRIERAAGQDRFLIDPDGKMWPIRGVDAVDFKPQKGSIVVQKGVGSEPYTILDRGGLPGGHAKGLLQRALGGFGTGQLGAEF